MEYFGRSADYEPREDLGWGANLPQGGTGPEKASIPWHGFSLWAQTEIGGGIGEVHNPELPGRLVFSLAGRTAEGEGVVRIAARAYQRIFGRVVARFHQVDLGIMGMLCCR